MKYRDLTKRLLAVLLAACMLLSLAACGGGTTTEETDGSTEESQTDTSAAAETTSADSGEEMGYVATYPDLGVELSYYDGVQVRGENIYITGEYYPEDYSYTENVVLTLDGEGSVLNTVRIRDEGEQYIQSLVVADDYLLASIYEWRTESSDEGEDTTADDWTTAVTAETTATDDDWTTSEESDWTTADADTWGETTQETAEATETETETVTEEETEGSETGEEDETEWVYEEEYASGYAVYSLAKYTMDGELISQQEMEIPEDSEWFYMSDLSVDADGNIYYDCDQTIYVMDPDGNALFDLTVSNWVMTMFTGPDGQVYALYFGDEGRVLAPIDVESQDFGEEVTIDSSTYYYNYAVGLDGELYAFDDESLARVDLENGTCETVLYWLDWDINGNDLNELAVLESGDLLLFGYNSTSDDYEPEMTLLRQVPLSEIPQKTEITLGYTGYLDYNMTNYILEFNKKNEQYRIKTVDYSSYNTSDDYTLSYSQLDQDILSGNAPDILCMSGLETDKYTDKGVLADLYSLMGADTYEKDDFVPSYLAAMETDGGLYTISSYFSVNTLIGARSYVGDEAGWSLTDFLAAVEKLPEDGMILDYETRDDFLNTMLYLCYDAFVDSETGQCSFDSEEFVALLEACMLFPEDYTAYEAYHVANGTDGGYSVDQDYYNMIYQDLRDGVMLLTVMDFDLDFMKYGSASCLTDDLIIVGYPGAGGSGAVISAGTEYAISATSEYQDVAWEFLCTAISDTDDLWGCSVLQEVLDEQLDELLVQDGYTDENGDFIPYDWETALTQDQADQVRAAIEGATCSYHYDSTIQEIAAEEAAAFFAGQKDAATVAALIQDRVQTYLDEQG